MRIKMLLAVMVLTALMLPAVASARTSCIGIYELCLNNSWNTSGITRMLADIECAARYAGCIRSAIL